VPVVLHVVVATQLTGVPPVEDVDDVEVPASGTPPVDDVEEAPELELEDEVVLPLDDVELMPLLPPEDEAPASLFSPSSGAGGFFGGTFALS